MLMATILGLIPRDPWLIPDEQAHQQAAECLAGFVRQADQIHITVNETPIFVDAGARLTHATCPRCQHRFATSWQAIVERAAEHPFRTLDGMMPCWGTTLSLNDLQYDRPAGWARFLIEAVNPKVEVLSIVQMRELEHILDCSMRQILIPISDA